MLFTGGEARMAAVDEQTEVAHALTRRHFLAHYERPRHLADVEITALDPCLRTLLYTDGTITRTLEVLTLNRVRVEVVEQNACPPPEYAERYLHLDGGEDCIERRVRMFVGESEMPGVWAESHLIPDRLPDDFLDVLGESPEGIGESLQQLMLESARELLWFGLGAPPDWVTDAAVPQALTRLYRVTSHGETALLIAESFAVEMQSGLYGLAHPDGYAATPPRAAEGHNGLR
jgi:chorismate-pyruvate lyase